MIAFGISANGDYICFDYRKCNENPCIILMYHDDFYEDDGKKDDKTIGGETKIKDDEKGTTKPQHQEE